ncbi:hypothetical protein BH20VER1_BH20VER1_27720 [soil metagenome]
MTQGESAGKMLRELRKPGAFHSFDHGGWHFAVLDYLKEEAVGKFLR